MRGMFLVAGLLAGLMMLEARGAQKDAPALLAAPAAAKQAEAEQRIKAVFSAEYADRSQRGRVALAQKLMQTAEQSSKDPVARYVLLREARDKAAAAGELELAMQAVDALTAAFIVDGLAMRAEVIAGVAPMAQTPTQQTAVAQACMETIDEAIFQDKYPAIMRLLPMADLAANRSGDAVLAGEVDARVKQVRALAAEHARTAAATEQLKKDPDNASANLSMGRYLCLYKGDWDTGLPMLAKGSDAALKTAAERDLNTPAEARAELAAGDAWWDLTGRQPEIVREQLRERACYWYRQAQPQLSGLDKVNVEKRLAEAGEELARLPIRVALPADMKLEAGLMAEFFRGMKLVRQTATRVDAALDLTWDRHGPGLGVRPPAYSIRWKGVLVVPPAGLAGIGFVADDGVRVFIDGQQVIAFGRPARQLKPVRLSAGPHAIQVEYWNRVAGGRAALLWVLPGAREEQTVPAGALFHVVPR